MKKNIAVFFLFFIFYTNASAQLAQYSFCPLDLTNISATPTFISAPQHDVMWVGMQGFSASNSKLYGYTKDGGDTFKLASVPEPLDRGCSSVFALNADTAWIGMTDIVGGNGGSIWKTNNGGINWQSQTTTEFSGGFLNFVCFFSPDSGIAMGDPNGGYFEIYTTNNGGSTWTRVNQSKIPVLQSNEYGYQNNYARIGDRIWFPTSTGRVFRSSDKGFNWTASMVDSSFSILTIDMIDSLNGVGYNNGSGSAVNLTHDGGLSWTKQQITPALAINGLSAIKNSGSTYIFKQYWSSIYATTDNFASYSLIAVAPVNTQELKMFDATIGWTQTSAPDKSRSIIKISNVLTNVRSTESDAMQARIFPNPVSAAAALLTFYQAEKANSVINLNDITGKLIRSETVRGMAGQNSIVFDFNQIENGLYIISITAGKQFSKLKVIVNRN